MSRTKISNLVTALISDYKLQITESFFDKLVNIFIDADYEYQDICEFMESLYLTM